MNEPPRTSDASAAGGLLEWGVKAGFRRYVQALPDGLCDISPDIALPGQGRFGFPLAGTDGSPPSRFRSTGTVTFRGHGDLLFVSIADPWLTRDDETWLLTCRDASSATGRTQVASGRLSADLAHTPELLIPLRLSHTGVALFGGNYPPGEPMDDLIVRLPSGAPLGAPTHHP